MISYHLISHDIDPTHMVGRGKSMDRIVLDRMILTRCVLEFRTHCLQVWNDDCDYDGILCHVMPCHVISIIVSCSYD